MGVQYDSGEEFDRKTMIDKKLIDSKIYTNAFGIDERGTTDIRPKEGLELLFNLEEEEKAKPLTDLFQNSPMLSSEALKALMEAAKQKNYNNS
jgi:hypothetical protein